LRQHGVEVEATTFEAWPLRTAFRLVYAGSSALGCRATIATRRRPLRRFRRHAGRVLEPRREWDGPLGTDNDAAHHEHAPHLTNSTGHWDLDRHLDELAAVPAFERVTKRVVTWEQRYSTDEWVTLLGTHSDHRILSEEQRTRLHAAVGDVIDRHGGSVDVVYDTLPQTQRRAS
jgi:hypothetical protein